MTDHTLITKVGTTLWGADWQAPMADAMMERETAIVEWASGRKPIPAGFWKELREVARLHALKIADLDPQIVQAYDATVALASKSRK
jgi:hypothetical protein